MILMLKVTAISLLAGIAFFAMDPTTKGFLVGGCIAAIPPTITGIFGLIKINKVEAKVDGILSKAHENEKAATSRADKSEAKAEGIKEEQDRTKP